MKAKILTTLIIISLALNSCLHHKATDTKNQDKETVKVDFTTLFYGSWVQPNPINKKEVQGFTLKADGQAESINMHTLLYKKWWVDNHKLYFVTESIGNKTSSTDTIAYEVIKISHDELQLKDRAFLLQYQKQP